MYYINSNLGLILHCLGNTVTYKAQTPLFLPNSHPSLVVYSCEFRDEPDTAIRMILA